MILVSVVPNRSEWSKPKSDTNGALTTAGSRTDEKGDVIQLAFAQLCKV